jgi:hypothetical protein
VAGVRGLELRYPAASRKDGLALSKPTDKAGRNPSVIRVRLFAAPRQKSLVRKCSGKPMGSADIRLNRHLRVRVLSPQACSRSLLCVETWLEISMCDAACLSLTAGGIRSRKNRRAGRDIGAAAWKAARLASGRSRRINEKIAIAPPDAVTPMSVLQIVNGLKSSVARGTHAAAISPKVTYVRDMR